MVLQEYNKGSPHAVLMLLVDALQDAYPLPPPS